jgi:putative membrane protein
MSLFFARVWRGLLMGLAEVVPGVSGGTMALLTGIYRELVQALASFGVGSFALLRSPQVFINHHHLGFLTSLATGMVLGIIFFARLMKYLLANFPPPVWAFFFGVIAVSAVMVASKRSVKTLLGWGITGLGLGLAMLLVPTLGDTDSLVVVFIGGAIAVCAWILPAVSGSYMLLLLGLYERIIVAISEFDLVVLAVLGVGCIVGLMSFVRLLNVLLRGYYERTMGLLCGFMFGSTLNLWPWRVVGETGSVWLTPAEYASLGRPDFFLLSGLACLLGGLGLWLLARRSEF